jgi:23S rRNA pseudouridine1911/1915/1917 synthase
MGRLHRRIRSSDNAIRRLQFSRTVLWHVRAQAFEPIESPFALTILKRATVSHGEPLISFLLGTLGLKRREVKNLLKFGAVAVNGSTVRQFDHPLAIGDEVRVSNARVATAAGRLEHARIHLVYEDATLIVVEKPAGLLTVAAHTGETDTLFVRLNEYMQGIHASDPHRALIVHRLDRETSGLVLLAKSEEVRHRLQAAWPEVEKIYLAVVVGRPEPAHGTINTYLTETATLQVFSNDHPTPGGQLAITDYRLLQTRGDFSLLEVRLETGRKHQIRVHLADLGCPVVGDTRYGETLNPCRRLALHANKLAFAHPLTGERLAFNSPLPAALHKLFPGWKDRGARPVV